MSGPPKKRFNPWTKQNVLANNKHHNGALFHSPVEHGENHQEANMNTPKAISLGMVLISAAIFFKETSVKPIDAYVDKPATCSQVGSAVSNFWRGA